jgi:hypothetical protein
MNNCFRIKPAASFLSLLLFLAFLTSGFCQVPAANPFFDKLVEEAKAILNEGSYANNPARAAALQQRLMPIRAKLDSIGPHLKLAENRSLREIFLTRLKKRNAAYQLVMDGKSDQLPTREMAESQKVQDCISLLSAYVADTSRSVFVDANGIGELTVRKNFLEQLTPCLSAFAKDDNSLRRADTLLTKMFVYKRVDFVQWLNLLENDPEAASRLSTVLMHKDKLGVASKILSEIIRAGDDSQRLSELIHGLFNATDSPTLIRVFERILVEFGDDPGKMAWLRLQIAQAANYQSRNPALAALLDLMDRVRNERLLGNIIRLLEKSLSETDTSKWQMAKAIQRVQDEVLREAGDQFEKGARLIKLAEKAKTMIEQSKNKKLRLSIPTIWRSGDSDEAMDATYYRTMTNQIAAAFAADYIVNASTEEKTLPDTLKNKISATSGEPVDSTFLDYVSRLAPRAESPHIIATGTYTFSGRNKPMALQLYLIDAVTGIVLGVYPEKISFNERVDGFALHAREAADRLAAAFKSELTAYLEFEIFARTFSADAVDLKNFRSYLFYDTIFDIEPGASFDSLRGIVAERIYIEEDFFTTREAGRRFSPLLDSLSNTMVAAYPDVPPVVVGGVVKDKAESNYLYLSGEHNQGDNAWELDIQIRRDYLEVLNLHLTFRPNEKGAAITPAQAKYAAGFITESVKSFLGYSQKFFHETVDKSIKDTIAVAVKRLAGKRSVQPISRWNILPSLLLPGSGQLIIADRLDSALVSSTKRCGWIFFASAVALFGAAISFDQIAIDKANNDDLKIRNLIMAGAGAMGLVSAILAHRSISKHNKSVEAYHRQKPKSHSDMIQKSSNF